MRIGFDEHHSLVQGRMTNEHYISVPIINSSFGPLTYIVSKRVGLSRITASTALHVSFGICHIKIGLRLLHLIVGAYAKVINS